MKRIIRGIALSGALWFSGMPCKAYLNLTPLPTGFNNPIGIDYYPAMNGKVGKLIISANYSMPNTLPDFELIRPGGGRIAFSSSTSLTTESKLATARETHAFPQGTVFAGGEHAGEILRISPDGSQITLITLQDTSGVEPGELHGGLHVDTTGIWNYELIAVTTSGGVWRVDANNQPHLIIRVPGSVHLEGVTTVPNSSTYGPWAGCILAGAENEATTWAIKQNSPGPGYTATPNTSLGLQTEDVDIIPSGENFFGVNFGDGKIMTAPASDFANYVGQILITEANEVSPASGRLWAVRWDPATSTFVKEALTENNVHWEHVTFAPFTFALADVTVSSTVTPAELGGIWEELTSFATFTVSRTGDTEGPLNVNLHMAGSATFGSDYSLSAYSTASFVATIPSGAASISFTAAAIDDSTQDSGEDLTLTIDPKVVTPSEPEGYNIPAPGTSSVAIYDQDAQTPPPTCPTVVTIARISNAAESTSPSSGWGTLRLTRTAQSGCSFYGLPAIAVRISFSGTASTSDFNAYWQSSGSTYPVNGYVIMPPVDNGPHPPYQTVDISIRPVNDGVFDPGESVVATILPATDPNDYVPGSPNVASLTIADNESQLTDPVLGESLFEFNLRAESGTTWNVEASSDLTAWTLLAVKTVSGGVVSVADSQAGSLNQRFYRASNSGGKSVNGIGYYRITVPSGYSILGNQLDLGNNDLNLIMPLPDSADGAQVTKYDPVTQNYYSPITFFAGSGWEDTDPPSLRTISPGEGFYFSNPLSTPLTLKFVGNLRQGSTATQVHGAMNMLCPPIPKALRIGDPEQAFPSGDSDIIYLMQNGNFQVEQYYSEIPGWDDATSPQGLMIPIGNGFWYNKAGGDTTWSRTFSLWP